jgi:hypothetical protein
MTVRVNASALPQPNIAGFANRCAVYDRGLFLDLVFYELVRQKSSGIARLTVPIDDLIVQFWPGAGRFLAEVEGHFSLESGAEAEVTDVPKVEMSLEPALVANYIRLARTGLTAAFDFYFVTPTSIANQQGAGGEHSRLSFLPLLCVQAPTTLVIALLTTLKPMLPEFRSRLAAIPELQGRLKRFDSVIDP